ncbi:TonB-dependent receptor [Rubrolithibacter danxiaensis]|uniref:TonB-dependent receptor n=1 Tax=Rubrolithibacter danxiaensis TaxID=3390805 RepID=UPI003BF90E75
MKFSRIFLFSIFLFFWLPSYSSVFVVKGRVIDASTKEPLPGATISFPDLRISVVTDANGQFSFTDLPVKGRFLLEAKYIGYATFTQVIDLSSTVPLEIQLKASVIEAHEVVVTGTALTSENRKNSTNVTSVSKAELLNRPSTNLVDAISRTAGVSQVTTGAAVSKPVIRGLSYNRVVTLVDGAKQEGQQWGDEHGIEVDQYNTGRVEVLRGAASLLYGSDALGGVINILDPLPPSLGQVKGEIITNYATNNGQSGNSLMIEGNQNGFVWRGRGSYKNAFSYNTPDGRIPNTGYTETDLSGQIGFNKSWGYTNLTLSSFKNKLGLPEVERNEDGQFTDEEGIVFTPSQLKSRDLFLPFQDVRHYKAALNSNILFGHGHLRSTFAYQDNQRRELEESRTDPSLFFNLKTFSYDLKYYFSTLKGWEPVFGIAGSFQDNKNKAEEKLIPDYNSNDFGAFAFLKKTWKNTTLNYGLRFDYRHIEGKQMEEDGEPKFTTFSNNFSNLSGAIGFTQEFTDQLSLKANLGSAFRSPNIAELSAEGVHEGTFRYEIGNASLRPEKSYYADLSLEYDTDKLHAAISTFNNYIDNYIYYRQNNAELINIDGQEYPVFRYVQDNANLYGAEAGLTLHPVDLIHFDNSFSFTHAENRATNVPLPFIPAARLRNELRFEPKFTSQALKNPYLSIELDNVFKQTRIDIFETPTSAYTLVNLGLGTTFMFGKQSVRANISANNLFNKAYVEHLSRLKYEDIFNQGRNISFGLYIPFTVKQ